jgi:xanthine dehydrogenase molybdenum-binding subunit
MGALIANAVHDALGVRIRHMPITPERVLEALKAKG